MAVPEPPGPGAGQGAPVVPSQLECFVEQELGAHLAANTMSCVFCKAEGRGLEGSVWLRFAFKTEATGRVWKPQV